MGTYIFCILMGAMCIVNKNILKNMRFQFTDATKFAAELFSLFMFTTSKCKHKEIDCGFLRDRCRVQCKDVVWRYL